MKSEMDKIMEFVGAIDLKRTVREYADLEAIKQWALDSLGLDYQAKDRVMICSNAPYLDAFEPGSRLHDWKYSLVRGQQGVVEHVGFDRVDKVWKVWVRMERCRNEFEQLGHPYKFWYGPKDETPDGYLFCENSTILFSLDVRHVQKVR